MLTPSEFSTLLKDRADAAARVLERRRIAPETAIEALEVVGYKVYQGNDGTYNVQPPSDRASEYDAFPTVEPTPEAKGAFLAEYPAMLTIKDVAEITGLHVNSVRRLCRDGNIPSMKFGQKIIIPKEIFVEGLGIDEDRGRLNGYIAVEQSAGRGIASALILGTNRLSSHACSA